MKKVYLIYDVLRGLYLQYGDLLSSERSWTEEVTQASAYDDEEFSMKMIAIIVENGHEEMIELKPVFIRDED